MKIATKLCIALIVSAVLLIVFVTIAALVPALTSAYNLLTIIDIGFLLCISLFLVFKLT